MCFWGWGRCGDDNNKHIIQTISINFPLYYRNVPDEGYYRNVPDKGYYRNVPDEGYYKTRRAH
jgi:hypothetical protein